MSIYSLRCNVEHVEDLESGKVVGGEIIGSEDVDGRFLHRVKGEARIA